jgi:pectinesterase
LLLRPIVNGPDLLVVTTLNPLAVPRGAETVTLALAELVQFVPSLDPKKLEVVDAQGRSVLSQLVDADGDDTPDELVFQSDFGPNESKAFKLKAAERVGVSEADFKVYGRFVRERHDDFAWENDIIAHRMYGPDLETCKKEPLTTSGVDVWVKRVPRLVVNEWYMTDNYHQDHGEGADFYAVGKSRGCGGLGVWSGGKLVVSKNFTSSRVLANGPIRLIFELNYAAFGPAGAQVTETKRVTLDAGSRFNRFESIFKGGKGAMSVALGIAKHPGGVLEVEGKSNIMRVWEPLNSGASGSLGCSVVLGPGTQTETEQTDTDYLLVAPAAKSGSLVYYVGTAWDRASHISDAASWTKEAQLLVSRIATPVQVNLTALPNSPAAGVPLPAK